MTIAIFTFSLLGAMALGMPIAFALIACGVALMAHLSMFDTQIIAQNLINGADSFPLMAIPFFMLAGATMNAGGLSKRFIKERSGAPPSAKTAAKAAPMAPSSARASRRTRCLPRRW